MTPAQELRAQREAVMTGTWVRRDPEESGEACLVMRADVDGVIGLSVRARAWLMRSRLHFRFGDMGAQLIDWNDYEATHSQVIEVLDRAIKLADLAEEGTR